MGKAEKQVIEPADVGELPMGEIEPANPAIDDNTPALFERVEKLITDRGYERDAEGNWPEGVVFERHRLHREAPVTVKISFPNGDRIGAQGDTTEEAVTLLEQRLAEWPK
jgi:hypothetical protein